MMGRRIFVALCSVTALFASVDAGWAQEAVTADLATTATMVEDGGAADIQVSVSCPKKHDVLEAFVYITQDDQTSEFSPIRIRKCKGKPINYVVRVRAAEDSPFRAGDARASSYVLVETRDGSDTISGGDSEAITILSGATRRR